MKDHPCRRFRYFIPLIILVFIAVFGAAVYGLWNGVLTEVIGVKAITYWQALGILLLAKILFGGFPCRGGRCGPWGRHCRPEAMEHWKSLTPEQRDQFRSEMRRRFGDWPRPSWCDEADDKPGAAPKA
jgi:hypothetical protein